MHPQGPAVCSGAASWACHWARAQPLFCKLIPLYLPLHCEEPDLSAIPAWFSEIFGLSSHSRMVLSPSSANNQQVQYFPSLAVCRAVSPLPPEEPRAASTYSLGTRSGVRNLADPRELKLAVCPVHSQKVSAQVSLQRCCLCRPYGHKAQLALSQETGASACIP